MASELIMNITLGETRIARLQDSVLSELSIERDSDQSVAGNVYLGRITRVLPGMQAAFVDIGLEKAAFLYVADIVPDLFENLDEEEEIELEKPLEPVQSRQPSTAGPTPDLLPEPEHSAAPQPDLTPPEHAQPLDAPLLAEDIDLAAIDEEEAMEESEHADPSAPHDEMLAEGEEADDEEDADEDDECDAPASTDDEGDDDDDEAAGNQAGDSSVDEVPLSTESGVVPEGTATAATAAENASDAPSQTAQTQDRDQGYQGRGRGRRGGRGRGRGGRGGRGRDGQRFNDRDGRSGNTQNTQRGNDVRTAGYSSSGDRKVVSEGGRREGGDRNAGRRGGRPRRGPLPRIEDLVKEGQTIVVQVAKEPIRTKGARVTSHISLPGRYLVYMPTVNHVGISRRISTYEERMRLKRIIYAHKPPSGGFICRTICAGVDEDKLVEDIKSLIATWQNVYEKQQKSRPPSLLHTDLGIVLRTVRDNLSDDVGRLVIDSRDDHKEVISYVDRFMPELRSKVELYDKETPIFDVYGIETEINRALGKKVWLKSGGYLIIESSEALTAIDVNTGRFVGKRDFEETIVTTNLEAVEEVSYQLKLRSIGGIIIVDFIDMVKHQHRMKVYHALKDALRRDRVKTTISKISELGLIEMTRKRTRESLTQMLSETCFHCNGTGFVKTPLTIAFEVFREIKRVYTGINSRIILVMAHPRVAKVFFNEGRERLQEMEKRLGKRIIIETNDTYHVEHFEIRGKELPQREPSRQARHTPVLTTESTSTN